MPAYNSVGTESTKQAIRNADQVFRGKVVAERRLTIPFEFEGQASGIDLEFKQFTIQIEQTYKGKIKRGKVSITTGLGHGDCGFDFQINQE